MPALIYLIYSMTHVIIDMYKEEYSKAMIEFWISAIFTLLLNILCQRGLGIVSWLIISIPFILMTTIATLLMFAFEVNPATGQPLEKKETTDETLKQSAYAYPIVAHYKDNHPSSYDKNDKYTTVQTSQCQSQQSHSQPAQSQPAQSQPAQSQPAQSQPAQSQPVASISYQPY